MNLGQVSLKTLPIASGSTVLAQLSPSTNYLHETLGSKMVIQGSHPRAFRRMCQINVMSFALIQDSFGLLLQSKWDNIYNDYENENKPKKGYHS